MLYEAKRLGRNRVYLEGAQQLSLH
jgi:hypothetical protein